MRGNRCFLHDLRTPRLRSENAIPTTCIELVGVVRSNHGDRPLDGFAVGFTNGNAFQGDFSVVRLSKTKLGNHRSQMRLANLYWMGLRSFTWIVS